MAKSKEEQEQKYISLREAAKLCQYKYSQEYLSLRARQGKLRAKKFGRNWTTTKEWLDEYVVGAEVYNHNQRIEREKKGKIDTEAIQAIKKIEPPSNLPIEKLRGFVFPKIALPQIPTKVLAAATIVLLLVTGSVFGRQILRDARERVSAGLSEVSFRMAQGFDVAKQSIETASEDLDMIVLETVQAVTESSQRVSAFSRKIFSNFRQGSFLATKEVGLVVEELSQEIRKEFQALAHLGSVVVWQETFNVFRRYGEYLTAQTVVLTERAKFAFGRIQKEASKISEEVTAGFYQTGAGFRRIAASFNQTAQGLTAMGEGFRRVLQGTITTVAGLPHRVSKSGDHIFDITRHGLENFSENIRMFPQKVLIPAWHRFVLNPASRATKRIQEARMNFVAGLVETAADATASVSAVFQETAKGFRDHFAGLGQRVRQVPRWFAGLFRRELAKEPIREVAREPILEGLRETREEILGQGQEIIQLQQELRQEIQELQEREVPIEIREKEIIREIQRITKIEPVRIIERVPSQELADIRQQLNIFTGWSDDIDALKSLTQKLQASPPQIVHPTAPIYIAHQGIQVGGMGSFAGLGVSGMAAIGNLGVGGSTVLGSTSADTLTVNAASFFRAPAAFGNGALVIDTLGNLTTTGNIIIGDVPLRATNEEMLRGVVPILGFDLPVRTTASANFISVSRVLEDYPGFPTRIPGTVREYRFIIRYADTLNPADAVAANRVSSWRVWNVTTGAAAATFTVPATPGTDVVGLARGEVEITGPVAIPTGTDDWQIEVRLPVTGRTIQIYQIFLAAYDRVD